mmetsp:Transcript_33981/g.33125  ORF Transcript_33981/g.33125 Transcript_33981/m.33125 type:complete len:113 (-) Transcript_33981:348-686(-)
MDSKYKFFESCQKELVLVLPILHRVKNKTLYLEGYQLNHGLCKAMSQGFKFMGSILNKITLENNGIHDEEFKVVLEGLHLLKDLKSVIYKQNDIRMKSVEALRAIVVRPMPN